MPNGLRNSTINSSEIRQAPLFREQKRGVSGAGFTYRGNGLSNIELEVG